MEFIYSTGGREKYFSKTNVRDCVCRAIANATGKDYLEVYNGINEEAKKEHTSKRKGSRRSNARNGVFTATAKRYIEKVLGWQWVSCMGIGTGCQTHLRASELPSGTLILNLSRHFSCVKDGVLYDTYDCSRNGTRCVYGYWREPTQEEQEGIDHAKELIELQKQSIEETKKKIEAIRNSYKSEIDKINKKIKEWRHKQTLILNKMNKDIKKIKQQDADAFINKVLGD